MKISLGIPEHGWLAVIIKGKDFDIELDVSDVPIDPLPLMVEALISALHGNGGEVWWSLEPSWYVMDIRKNNEEYDVSLYYCADSFKRKRGKSIFSVSGSDQEIIIPMWRALRNFYSYNYKEPHWPACEETGMDILTSLVRSL